MVGGYYFWLGASADAETGSRASMEPANGLHPPGFDPARFMEVINRHSKTVTLTLLCDLAEALNLKLRAAVVRQ